LLIETSGTSANSPYTVLELRQVQAAVQGGYHWAWGEARQRIGEVIEVIVNNVEVLQLARQLAKRGSRERNKVAIRRIGVPERTVDYWYQARTGLRVTSCKERHVMSETHELLGQCADDPLCTSVPRGWNAFKWGCDLGDTHGARPPRGLDR
jgi:hypothetical protein